MSHKGVPVISENGMPLAHSYTTWFQDDDNKILQCNDTKTNEIKKNWDELHEKYTHLHEADVELCQVLFHGHPNAAVDLQRSYYQRLS